MHCQFKRQEPFIICVIPVYSVPAITDKKWSCVVVSATVVYALRTGISGSWLKSKWTAGKPFPNLEIIFWSPGFQWTCCRSACVAAQRQHAAPGCIQLDFSRPTHIRDTIELGIPWALSHPVTTKSHLSKTFLLRCCISLHSCLSKKVGYWSISDQLELTCNPSSIRSDCRRFTSYLSRYWPIPIHKPFTVMGNA